MRALAWLAPVLGLAGAASPPPSHAAAHFYVDPGFTRQEQAWIAEAAERLEDQTGGYLRIRIDVDRMVVDRDAAGERTLSRAASSFVFIRTWEKENGDETLYGLTYRARRVFLVADRLEGNHRLFVAVTMHEMLHALGCDHVADKGALLAKYMPEPAPVRLTGADLAEIARVHPDFVPR